MNITRHSNYSHTAIEVLRRGFSPTLKTSGAQRSVSHLFSPSPVYHQFFQSTRHKFRGLEPSAPSRPRDENILSPFVQIVSDETNKLLPPEPLSRVLGRIDRKTYFLVEFAKPTPESPHSVCKIVEKRVAREFEKNKAKPTKNLETTMKTLELNWAIGDNDFRHKTNQLEQFLAQGRRVIVHLEKKRKGRDALPKEASGLVDRLVRLVNGLEGGREYKQAEGQVGGRLLLHFERTGTRKEKGRGERETRMEAQAGVKSPNPTEHDEHRKSDARLLRKSQLDANHTRKQRELTASRPV